MLLSAPIVAAAAPSSDGPARYFGTPSGWSYRGSSADASASTLLFAPPTSGVLLLFCERDRIGFHLSLSTTDRRSLMGAEDGLLKIYPVDAPDAPPLAQFRIRLFSEHELRTAPLMQTDWDNPAVLLEIIRNHSAGLRLVMTRTRPDSFVPPRSAELYLPQGTDGSGLPIDSALAFLERDCHSGLESHDSGGGEP